jgi:glycosyltransferase involved in cell wall biosynthesis
VAQYTARLVANFESDEFDIELVTPTAKEAKTFFHELDPSLAIKIREAGLPRRSWTLAMRYLPFAAQLLDEIKSADLIHLTHFDLFPKNIPKSVRKVLTIHDMIFLDHPEWFTSRNLYASKISCKQLMNGQIDLVLTPSAHTQNRIREYGYGGEIRVTPLAPTTLFPQILGRPIQDLATLQEKPFVLYLGNLEPRKGVKDLIEAWTRSKAKNFVRLLILGKSAYLSEEIDSAIADAKNRNIDILHLGFVTESFKAEALLRARLMVYPSLDEGFGIPVLDAMSAGLPVITTTGGSLPEVAGNAAMLVEPGNVEDLRNLIDQVIEDEALLKSYSSLGLERSKLFSWEQTAAQTQTAYRDLLH